MEQQQAPAERGGRRFHLNPTIVAAVISVIGAVIVAYIAYRLSRPPEGPQITSPEEGEKVGHEVWVKGTALIEDEGRLWVIVQALDNRKYYPMENRVESGPDGTWQVRAFVGDRDNPEYGDKYRILVVKVSDGVCQELEDYRTALKEGKSPGGLTRLPFCAKPATDVTVVLRPG